jgi:phage-related protein
MNGIVQAFTGIVQILPELLKALIQATIFIVNALAEQLPTLIPQLIDAILEMIPILIDNLPLFIKAGWQLIIGLAQGILNSIPTLLSHLPKIGKAILNYLKQLPGMVVDIGKNIVKGIWSGLSNSLQWIKNKISGWVGNVMKFIKKLFGIHSPSTLMRDEVGVYLAQGLGVGFDDELDSVYRDMQKSIDFENAKLQANVESGKIFNSLVNSTPISISLDGSVEMDKQKVGRIITPVVSRTIKTGGGN